jgi:sigma-B regulation protein RsbU (phosphoserine phosphatase)
LSEADDAPENLADFEDLFENAPCGYLSTDKDGRIQRANGTLARWMGVEASALRGRRFPDLLTIGGKLFYETHFAPMLRMQGSITEVAVDLACADGRRIPTLVNAIERRDAAGNALFVRITIFNALERRRYEQGLVAANSEAKHAIEEQRALGDLREQFIAILGHDLRNPLAAIAGGVNLLKRSLHEEHARKILALMEGSVVRATGLIENVLDFTRTRLGGGIGASPQPDAPIGAVLDQVVAELRAISLDRVLLADIHLEQAVTADAGRIGQLASNLLGNALTHGAADQPIRLTANARDGAFVLSVANGGAAIPKETMAHLFQPFFRGAVSPNQQGLGLGLHIASEIAKLHGGRIAVASDDQETCFTFTMPCEPVSSD